MVLFEPSSVCLFFIYYSACGDISLQHYDAITAAESLIRAVARLAVI